jgi:hypothetical protein
LTSLRGPLGPEDCSVVVNHRQLGRVRGSFRHHEPYLLRAGCLSAAHTLLLETHPDQLRCWSNLRLNYRRKLCYSVDVVCPSAARRAASRLAPSELGHDIDLRFGYQSRVCTRIDDLPVVLFVYSDVRERPRRRSPLKTGE